MAFAELAVYGIAGGVLALIAAAYYARFVLSKNNGTPKMQEMASAIQSGAEAYLKRQLITIALFAVIVAALIWFGISSSAAIAFVFGAAASYLAGVIGMSISVRANVRTAEAAKKGLKPALDIAFKGGAVTGLTVVGLGLIGLAGVYMYFNDVSALIGFGLGASLISLFARVGGGIYTKAADVGADLVGKIEKGIPEDDPRNPAFIADNVGDNVGDCAGMGADLFESLVVTLMATMLLGLAFGEGSLLVVLPLLVGAIGAVSGIIGMQFVQLGPKKNIMNALNKGTYATVIVFAALLFMAFAWFGARIELWYAAITGLALTIAISKITEYYTVKEGQPVKEIAFASQTGAGTNLIQGLAVGLQSTAFPVLAIVAAILIANHFGGVYGIALAAAAMLSTTGIIIAIDSYGPITDNAGGIAVATGMQKSVRRITDELDAVGNTTKATTKGFAIASAALSALSLFVAYSESVGLSVINILEAPVVAGLFIGGLLPFIFASYLMKAVGRAAFKMVEEVRHQFKTIKGIMQGTAKPNYARCVDISTSAALKELFTPAVLAVTTPLIVGFAFGAAALGGLLAGAIVTGLLLALFMANGGAAWDNAKKYIEDGKLGGKGSDAHKAAVVGDTVGDPFKDTAGPALNSLIKVLNTVALIAAALIAANAPLFI
ncbi:sodium-translocating pyrophosphatase [Candidatus Micrarchaeota archaeon]|nr:sodium-translocating pyrophosphatase [Candidatus Micrarchaeota archaeon]